RNFQGFTEDQSGILIGLGASSISAFPGALLQNEKRAGRYHLHIANGRLATVRGIRRTPADRRRGALIEALLCRGEAECTGLAALPDVRARLADFEEHGLIA
ncbi:coproporphyrinogen III oxidase, partial [Escherichia coli]|nr:coproporphyrinogen III oxidase [Escherichia coli]